MKFAADDFVWRRPLSETDCRWIYPESPPKENQGHDAGQKIQTETSSEILQLATIVSRKPLRDDISRWNDNKKITCPVLVVSGETISYQPMRDATALYRVFLQTEPSPDGFKAFVLKYGLPLGGGFPEWHLRNPHECTEKIVATSEYGGRCHLDQLQRIHGDLQAADFLYAAIRTKNDDQAIALLKRMLAGNTHPDFEAFTWAIATLASCQDPTINRGSPIDHIERCLLHLVNNRLSSWGSSATLVRPGKQWDLVFCPHTLIGVMWLQLAAAIAGNQEVRHCRECGTPFEVGGGTKNHSGRNDKTLCGNTCRVRAYQRRQAKALEMHQQGKPAKEIAKALDTQVAKVKAWIAKAEAKAKSIKSKEAA